MRLVLTTAPARPSPASRQAAHHGIPPYPSSLPARPQVVPVAKVAPRLRERLCLDVPEADFVTEARRIVDRAANHKGTVYYDKAQNMQRGIAI